MIRVATIENRFEADLITRALTTEGIEYLIKTFEDTAYDGLFVTQKGYAALFVNETDEDLARSIVDEIRAAVESNS